MLKVMDDHIKLAFTHILKHWKKGNGMNASATKTLSNSPGSQGRTVLLRYYPPPSKRKYFNILLNFGRVVWTRADKQVIVSIEAHDILYNYRVNS